MSGKCVCGMTVYNDLATQSDSSFINEARLPNIACLHPLCNQLGVVQIKCEWRTLSWHHGQDIVTQ